LEDVGTFLKMLEHFRKMFEEGKQNVDYNHVGPKNVATFYKMLTKSD
jgi:hypothetical protein